MLKNYIKIAFRNLIRHKSFSLLNIAGLSVGMASSILILLWVQNEKSYDRFHANAHEIYRITVEFGDEFHAAVNPPPMSVELKAKIPAIKNIVRLTHPMTSVFWYDDKRFEEKGGFYTDSTFLDVFSFPLLAGDAATALKSPDAILITERMAIKYFGDTNPIGKTLRRENNQSKTVTGVLGDIPANSHLQFDYLMPLSSLDKNDWTYPSDEWGNFIYYAYIQLEKTFEPTTVNLLALEKQMNDIYKIHQDESVLKSAFTAQPLRDIHLHSNLQVDLSGHGNIQYVNILFIVAIFILLVACINFMNLATARSSRRAKEVGMRKVVGAARSQLVGQFLGESIFISLISLLLAIGMVWLALPTFNYLAGKELAITLFDGKTLLSLLGIALLTGIVAGSYPALFLSGFRPIAVLKGTLSIKGSGGRIFRNTLVITQFVVSIVLLVGTMVVYRQLHYMKDRNIGYEKSNLMYVPMSGEIWGKQEAYKNALKENPLTTRFTVIDAIPSNLKSGTIDHDWEGKDPNSQIVIPVMDVSESFFEVFQTELAAGRAFSTDFKGDSSNYIINEKLSGIMDLNPEEAIGKPFSLWGKRGMIVGVVKDFNFKPATQSIEPIVLQLNNWGGIAVVRTQPKATEATIKALEEINAKLNPDFPFTYGFVDQDLNNLYDGEQRLANLFNLFAILAIGISCLGLYGLSAFVTEQKFKEIGIRKVLGARVISIVYLLSKNFIKLILLAIIIATLLALYALENWLNSFAYRIDIQWWIFALAGLAAILVALITVATQTIKAALANPVDSLRDE
ncbi:ABC transporter permease [Olivibacter sitiensis]|uniref:ABC transporter permease n=1 Tax=Olivibacter sitiensis TaxID=376470 RepID=UPI0003F97E2B|nr:ABC transporter permease [Olivibacter sitiensis]